MRLISAGLFAAAVLTAVVPAEAADVSLKPLQLVDLVGEFDAVVQRSEGQAPERRAAAIRDHFASRLPGFYSPNRIGHSQQSYDRFMGERLSDYEAHRSETMAARARFNAALTPALERFEKAFGPVRGSRPVYLVVSLGEFDGGTRSLPDGNTLLFGADMIARYHGAHDPTPFFHHELFHLIHGQRFGDCLALWCSLWSEGLATYVAKTLNPEASDDQLLLTIPEPIRPAVDGNRTEAVCAIRARMDLTESNEADAIFSGRRLSPTLPSRFGYYVGMLVAADLGRTRSLQQLADLRGPELRNLIGRSLDGMASCRQAR